MMANGKANTNRTPDAQWVDRSFKDNECYCPATWVWSCVR